MSDKNRDPTDDQTALQKRFDYSKSVHKRNKVVIERMKSANKSINNSNDNSMSEDPHQETDKAILINR